VTAVRVAKPASLPDASARYVVVEASAGTGKTYFLEHRVADLVLAGTRLTELCLVTFTEKAVAELRLRVRDLLDRLSRTSESTAEGDAPAWLIDDDARRRLRVAVAEFDQAPISTIHGFCHRILVEDAFAAARLFEQVQVADEVAFDAAYLAELRERFARHELERGLLGAYLTTGKTTENLRDVLLACARAGDEARVYRSYDPEAVTKAVAGLREHVSGELHRKAIAAEIKNGSKRKAAESRMEDIAAALAELPPDAPPPVAFAVFSDKDLNEALSKLRSYTKDLPKYAALDGLLADMLDMGTLDQAIAATFLPHVLARVARDKAARGQFDYDDMLRLVWGALQGARGPEVAARLRARMPVAMIDEFQDTDPLQWRIFREVWVHPDARSLTIVGDPKQAIYGFRGADVYTYLAAKAELLAAGAVRVSLAENRRSTAPLVAAVNEILGSGPLTAQMMTGAITYDEPVTAAADVTAGTTAAPIAVLRLVGKSSADANKTALQRAIGDAIEAMHAVPPTWRAKGQDRRFTLRDAMVLTRSNRESMEIAAALRSRGLPCALVEPEKLFETREAHELVTVLAAVAAPRDRSARMRALRTRFFDVPWPELARVVDAPDHHPLIARLHEWALLAARRAYEPLFRRLVEDSHYAERALVLGSGERALTNTWHLIELLLAEVARSRGDLHELVSVLNRWMTDETMRPDELDVQRAETDAEAIRILTVHKAKGLEAPFVFFYGGTGGTPPSSVRVMRDESARLLVVGQHEEHIKQRIARESEEEDQRLAYVALTRAQIRLYLPLYPDGAVKANAMYHPIQRCLGPRLAKPSGLFELFDVEIGADELPPAPDDALAGFAAPAPPPTVITPRLAAERAGLTTLSYTRLARDAAGAAIMPTPTAFEAAEERVDDARGTEVIVVGPDELPPGADAGLMLHDVLEVADLSVVRTAPDAAAWRSDPDVARQLAAAARARGIADRYVRHASERIHATLTEPLALIDGSELPPLVAADQLAREVEFAYPYRASSGSTGLVKGFIDAMVVYGDELWVLDYKSDALGSPSDAKARVAEHYDVQARLYALAAERMCPDLRFAGLLFAFVRYGVVVARRVDAEKLAEWRTWLETLPVAPPDPRGEVTP